MSDDNKHNPLDFDNPETRKNLRATMDKINEDIVQRVAPNSEEEFQRILAAGKRSGALKEKRTIFDLANSLTDILTIRRDIPFAGAAFASVAAIGLAVGLTVNTTQTSQYDPYTIRTTEGYEVKNSAEATALTTINAEFSVTKLSRLVRGLEINQVTYSASSNNEFVELRFKNAPSLAALLDELDLSKAKNQSELIIRLEKKSR